MEKVLNNKWSKIGLLSAAGLLLAASLAFAGYKLGQKQAVCEFIKGLTPTLLPSEAPTEESNQITGWRTFRNTRHNYEIEYPAEWRLQEHNFSKKNESYYQQVSFLPPRGSTEMKMTIIALRWVSKEIQAMKPNTEINRWPALRFYQKQGSLGNDDIKYDEIYVHRDDKWFVIISEHYSLSKDSADSHLYTFNKMVNTFRFAGPHVLVTDFQWTRRRFGNVWDIEFPFDWVVDDNDLEKGSLLLEGNLGESKYRISLRFLNGIHYSEPCELNKWVEGELVSLSKAERQKVQFIDFEFGESVFDYVSATKVFYLPSLNSKIKHSVYICGSAGIGSRDRGDSLITLEQIEGEKDPILMEAFLNRFIDGLLI